VTTNAARAALLARALQAGVKGDHDTIRDVFTDDVKAWAPAMSVASRSELAAELDRRDDAFAEIELDVTPLDVGGDYACAEWSVTMIHSGRLTLPDGTIIAPTGLPIALNGVTVAEFRGERICSLRQYWDEFSVLEQLGIVARHGDSGP
jgi:ketosteroid isomerase-like protein